MTDKFFGTFVKAPLQKLLVDITNIRRHNTWNIESFKSLLFHVQDLTKFIVGKNYCARVVSVDPRNDHSIQSDLVKDPFF